MFSIQSILAMVGPKKAATDVIDFVQKNPSKIAAGVEYLIKNHGPALSKAFSSVPKSARDQVISLLQDKE